MTAVYNEIVPYACAWLRNLIDAGHIAPGRVLENDIRSLAPGDVAGEQAHFFAGIGVWSHALRLAGWPDDLPVWTGSCPCQPFSAAGRKGGFADERHLWPDWFRLIQECRPPIVLGEQVASPDGRRWLDLVSSDLEGAGYAFGASDLPAAGVGAPHIRQRLWFVAVAPEQGRVARRRAGGACAPGIGALEPGRRRAPGDVADADGAGLGVVGRARLPADGDAPRGYDAHGRGAPGELGDARGAGGGRDRGALPGAQGGGARGGEEPRRLADEPVSPGESGPTWGFWRPCEWVACRDGKARPVEPGTFPLAHGAPDRVGRLRAFGNAIVAPLAATWVRAVMDYLDAREAERCG